MLPDSPAQTKITQVWALLKYPLLAFIFGWLCYKSIPAMTGMLEKGISMPYVLAALIVYQIGIFILSERFRLILFCVNIKRPFLEVFRAYVESIPYFFISPGGIGIEMARYLKLKKNEPGEFSHIISALLADRLAGFIGAFILIFLGWSTLIKIQPYFSLPLFFTGCLILLAAAIAGFFALKKMPAFRNKLKDIMKLFISHPATLSVALFYSVLVHAILGSTVYLLGLAAGVHVEFITVLWVTAASMLLMVVPLAVFGFSLTDAAIPFLYLLSGVSLPDATFLVIIGFLMRVWLALQGIIVEFFMGAARLKQAKT